MDADLYRHLAEGRIGPYLRAAPHAFRKWSATQPNDRVLSIGRDGTVLEVRLGNERQRRS